MRTTPAPTLSGVSAVQWERLAAKRLFFGHQSVGGNLMAGVREVLAQNPQIRMRVMETADPAAMTGPGLYHGRVGSNGGSKSKLEAFSRIVAGSMARDGTALLKYCYVDVSKDTDAGALFEEYRTTVDGLKAAHAGLTIVHVTMPLTSDPGWLRHMAAVARGLTASRSINRIRERYNELLRRTYLGREPVFDLAREESTLPNGRRATVRYQGEAVPVLAKAWTHDGGHLNRAGRQRMAEEFLLVLAGC